MDAFIVHFGRSEKAETLQKIEAALAALHRAEENVDDDQQIAAVLEAIRDAACHHDKIIVPVELPQAAIDALQKTDLQAGTDFTLPEDMHFQIRTLRLPVGKDVFAAFTSLEEERKGEEDSSTIAADLEEYLQKALFDPSIEGVTLNPWGNFFYLSKQGIQMILHANLPPAGENIFTIQTMDIAQADVECIVNAANNSLLGGGGVDGAIHRAAGPDLLKECRTLHGCKTGESKITGGYRLKARYIIHTVGPVYSGAAEDAKLLHSCYWNSLELARAHGIHSIAFPAISTGVYGYPLRAATEIALKVVTDWMKVYPDAGMSVLFACFDDRTAKVYRDVWKEHETGWNQRPIIRENDGMLEQAVQFAMDAHKGAVRKGSGRPYILHSLETLTILASMDADVHLMAAGVLHDTVEDTRATALDLYDRFGVDVATLVGSNTEDKGRIWYMRKLTTVTRLPDAGRREKMLAMADAVANLREMAVDAERIGEAFWQRFNAPKEWQSWYYSKLADALEEMQQYSETADVYWEMTGLYKDLFVRYFVDDSKDALYQVNADGEGYVMKKDKLQWKPLKNKVPKKARQIHRREAERIEDNWNDANKYPEER